MDSLFIPNTQLHQKMSFDTLLKLQTWLYEYNHNVYSPYDVLMVDYESLLIWYVRID
jgi:hypothetical protein